MTKTSRNDKCPCGSGKKHKHCCISRNSDAPAFDEIVYLKQFDPLSVVLWLQVVICHPSNSVYICRLYFLLGLTLSIPEKDFGKKVMTYQDVKRLFDSIEKVYSRNFYMLEDFEGFDQSKLIPIFINQKKYYFFYGNFERPYEYLKQLRDIYFFTSDNEADALYRFQRDAINSLEFQTALLESLKTIPENSMQSETVYVPTLNYYNHVTPHFILGEYSMLPDVTLKAGDFNKLTVQQILEKSVEMKLFNKTHIDVGGKLIWITPHLHLEIFINKGRTILKKDPVLQTEAYTNFKNRLNNLCRTFFSDGKEILAVLEKDSDQNLLKDDVDFATFIDDNKLFLFAAVDYSYKDDISEKLNEKLGHLNELRKRILSNEIIGIFERQEENAFGVYTKPLEIWLIPVYESICLNVLGSLKKGVDASTMFFVLHMDLRAVFDKIEKPFEFLKFLREDNSLQDRSKAVMGEFMDRFWFYVHNGNSYMRSGRTFSHGVFSAHMWSDHFFDEYWKRYQDNAYEEIELRHQDFFNRIESNREGFYQMINTAERSASYLIKWKDRFVWFYLPPMGKLEYYEIHIGAELIAPMMAEYLKAHEILFQDLLNKNGIDQSVTYSINIISKSLIESTSGFTYFKDHITRLNDDNPMVFETGRVGFKKVKTFIVYDYELFPKLFSLPQNIGERYAIRSYVKSIVEFHTKDSTEAQNVAEIFVETHVPVGIKGYSVEVHHVSNAGLEQYIPPIEMNDAEVGITQRKISEFLIENEIKPGDYTNEEAKSINYRIYTFLQGELESMIASYDKQFLIYAYKQLERSEGDRHLRKIKLGMQAKGRTDYDIVEYAKETESKNSQLNVCIKHIIHTALKVGSSGTVIMTAEIWTRLISLADSIMAAASIYDYIQYDLREHVLRVTDDYLIEDITGEEAIDSTNLNIKHTEIKIERAKRAHTKAMEVPNEEVEKEGGETQNNEVFDQLDVAFRTDLNFSYEDLFFVLGALSRLPLSDGIHFPVSIKSIQELSNEIAKADKKGMSEQTLEQILNFLCLYTGIYDSKNLLYPSDMMRNKKRINVSPFIKLKEKLFLYGNEMVRTSLAFWSSLVSGDFPFINEDYPNIKEVIKSIHRSEDLALEKWTEEEAIRILGVENVEARVSNFKRLSETFKKNESCGEIDLLCINRTTKIVFVIDAKNINKKMSIYHIRQSIRDFFDGQKSYYSKLLKKKVFIEENLQLILSHFKVDDPSGWRVVEAFVSEDVYFAAYYNKVKVDFILTEDLGSYLKNNH